MNRLGFRQSTLSGLSFATDDLITPPNKAKIIAAAERSVMRITKLYQRGIITEGERYNQVLDAWTHAREQITTEMMTELENDRRFPGYVNPIFLMAHSGARGGVEQIRQLAGMRGLMAKPSGKIIETPIKANFREGLSVLEYFSSTHGARKGLADTALKTADSGYLTRKLADVAPERGRHDARLRHDAGHHQGGYLPRREGGSQSGRLRPRPRQPHEHRQPDHRRGDRARKRPDYLGHRAEDRGARPGAHPGPQPDDVRRPAGRLRLCYGMDLSTGSLVEQGMAVGIIGAQSIGEPGTQLTMRTFHIGGTAAHAVEESEIKAKKQGVVKFTRLKVVRNDAGQQVVLTRNGEILILDPKGRELEKYEVPAGANLQVDRKPGGRARARSSANGTRTPSQFSPKSAARSATRT